MKTKVLFAAALLLSASAFAQEVAVKNKQAASVSTTADKSGSTANASINSSSKTTIKSSAADKAAMNAGQNEQEANKTVVTQKESVAGQARTNIATAQKTIQEKSNGSGSIHASAQAGAHSESNKISQDASLSNQGTISAEGVKSSGKEVKKEGQASLNTQTAAAVQTANQGVNQTKSSLAKTNASAEKQAKMADGKVKAHANAGTANAIHSGAGIANASKPKPASVKMQTQLKSNARLKIK
jgi:hypothetical protein